MKEKAKMNNDAVVEEMVMIANRDLCAENRISKLLEHDSMREVFEDLPDSHKVELLKELWGESVSPMLQLDAIEYDALSKIHNTIQDDNFNHDELGHIYRVYVTDKVLTRMFEGASSTFDCKLGGSWYREEKHAWGHLKDIPYSQFDSHEFLNIYVISVDIQDVEVVWTGDHELDVYEDECPTVTIKNPDWDLAVCHKYVGTFFPT